MPPDTKKLTKNAAHETEKFKSKSAVVNDVKDIFKVYIGKPVDIKGKLAKTEACKLTQTTYGCQLRGFKPGLLRRDKSHLDQKQISIRTLNTINKSNPRLAEAGERSHAKARSFLDATMVKVDKKRSDEMQKNKAEGDSRLQTALLHLKRKKLAEALRVASMRRQSSLLNRPRVEMPRMPVHRSKSLSVKQTANSKSRKKLDRSRQRTLPNLTQLRLEKEKPIENVQKTKSSQVKEELNPEILSDATELQCKSTDLVEGTCAKELVCSEPTVNDSKNLEDQYTFTFTSEVCTDKQTQNDHSATLTSVIDLGGAGDQTDQQKQLDSGNNNQRGSDLEVVSADEQADENVFTQQDKPECGTERCHHGDITFCSENFGTEKDSQQKQSEYECQQVEKCIEIVNAFNKQNVESQLCSQVSCDIIESTLETGAVAINVSENESHMLPENLSNPYLSQTVIQPDDVCSNNISDVGSLVAEKSVQETRLASPTPSIQGQSSSSTESICMTAVSSDNSLREINLYDDKELVPDSKNQNAYDLKYDLSSFDRDWFHIDIASEFTTSSSSEVGSNETADLETSLEIKVVRNSFENLSLEADDCMNDVKSRSDASSNRNNQGFNELCEVITVNSLGDHMFQVS